MRRTIPTLLCVLLLVAAAQALANDRPVASPFDDGRQAKALNAAGRLPDKAFGDPRDLPAALDAGATYLVRSQADITEDNAGNGNPDIDPDDGGWDWSSTVIAHSATASPPNIYGATAQGLYHAYLQHPTAPVFTAMKDAADHIVAVGPLVIRSAGDFVFLLNFASLPDVTNPAVYRDAARAMWTWWATNRGGAAAYIRDGRAAQGYRDGIIAWDIAPWIYGLTLLDAAFPGNGYAAVAASEAEVLWQDSFNNNPGYFQPNGRNKGYTLDWSNLDYWWYSSGVAGLIRAFAVTGVHTDELPGLQTLLLECQYPDGGFSMQYGAGFADDESWQDTAYSIQALAENLAPSPTTSSAAFNAAMWLAATQDVSGGWLYSDGSHYPEVGGECAMAVAAGWLAGGAALTATPADALPLNCSATKSVTFRYVPQPVAPGMRGYTMTISAGPAVSFSAADVHDAGSLGGFGPHYFAAVDNGANSVTISDAILGTTDGVQTSVALFTVDFHAASEGTAAIGIDSYKLRDPANADFFAELSGASLTVDCTAPPAVTGITAAPGHAKVQVSWSMADESGVDHYEIYRGLWYDTTPGVSAYPEYDDLAGDVQPTRPADRAAAAASAEWELAGTVPAGTLTLADNGMTTGRGVYWYEVFAVDAAVNFGPRAATNDRATNYWLGDVESSDGDVDSGDITVMGATFGLSGGNPGYNNTVDVGPTDDASGFGIPATDSMIDFEDLMIFAMNYGNVSAKLAPVVVQGPVVMSWDRLDDRTWVLRLGEANSGLKGVHLLAALPADVGCVVAAGDLLARQPGEVFLRDLPQRGLDVNLALIGRNLGFAGAGELLRVTLDRPLDVAPAITARGVDNSELTVSMAPGAGALPKTFVASQNYPNPFNPSTTIAYRLPEARHVNLGVYALDGGLIRLLVNDMVPAGDHTAEWNGRDDSGRMVASGAYFYRLTAGDDVVIRKMLLMK